jgi:hypothetical protein
MHKKLLNEFFCCRFAVQVHLAFSRGRYFSGQASKWTFFEISSESFSLQIKRACIGVDSECD